MTPSPLIEAAELLACLARPPSGQAAPLILDATFDLVDANAGQRLFEAAHIPGAHYLHLDTDLSGLKTGYNGRHPLPKKSVWTATLNRLGITPDRPVVVMDRNAHVFAARLWWMLHWVGHGSVRVLNGGWPAWLAAGGSRLSGPTPSPRAVPTTTQAYSPDPNAQPYAAQPCTTIDAATLVESLPHTCVIDARPPERFRGDTEPLDPVAGHIPGAINAPFARNLSPDGRFLSPAALRQHWLHTMADHAPQTIVHQCGSGASACLNLLATVIAELPMGRLYPGSWSEWCADPRRPVARGAC